MTTLDILDLFLSHGDTTHEEIVKYQLDHDQL